MELILKMVLALFIYDVLQVVLGKIFLPKDKDEVKESFRDKLDKKIKESK